MKRYPLLYLALALVLMNCSVFSILPSPTPILTTDTPSPIPITLTPQPTSTPSPTPLHDSALSFDGIDDYVMVSNHASLHMTDSFTIAAWIYMEEYTEWASIVTKGNKPNVNNYTIHQSGPNGPKYKTEFGKLRFTGCADLPVLPVESETILPLRTWHFVAITFNGIKISFYLNGELDGSIDVRGPLCTNEENLYIGVDHPGSSEYWHGALDEIRIWNSSLSRNQIREVMEGSGVPLEFALVGYWAFDEGSGSIAHDRSKYSNDGVLMGDPMWISPGPPIQR